MLSTTTNILMNKVISHIYYIYIASHLFKKGFGYKRFAINIDVIVEIYSIVFRYLYLAKRKESWSFKFTFRYEDDVLSLINYVDNLFALIM
jgi:hypothetical protein